MAGQNLLTAGIFGIPWYWFLIVGGVALLAAWLIKRFWPEGSDFKIKRVSLEKIAKEERREMFKYAKPYELGKILVCGPESFGSIQEMFFYKVSEMPKLLRGEFKFKKTAVLVCYITTLGVLGRLFYKLGAGLNYYLVESEKILNEDPSTVYINPFSQRDNFLGFNTFSELGHAVVENIIYKKIHAQHIEEDLNFLPKLTILEIERAKDSQTLSEVSKMAKLKSNEIIEQIRKGKA